MEGLLGGGYGDEDIYVPFSQSKCLYQAMTTAWYQVEFQLVPGYGHSVLLYMNTKEEFYKKQFFS